MLMLMLLVVGTAPPPVTATTAESLVSVSPPASLAGAVSVASASTSSAPSEASGMVLRIRLPDGSMERVRLPCPGAEFDTTLGDLLAAAGVTIPDGGSAAILVGGKTKGDDDDEEAKAVASASPTTTLLSDLGVRHGSVITVRPAREIVGGSSGGGGGEKTTNRSSPPPSPPASSSWDPFPDLAREKSHMDAVRRAKTSRSVRRGMSYGDVARMQEAMHSVEPQMEGPVKRLYMCETSAGRFHSGCQATTSTSTTSTTSTTRRNNNNNSSCRVGLLLGTIHRERVDSRPKRARTSLSSTTADSDYCTVAKVQTVWEPPAQSSLASQGAPLLYDVPLAEGMLRDHPRVVAVADHLGLLPVGWIFSYDDERSRGGGGGGGNNSKGRKGRTDNNDNNNNDQDDSLPVWGLDVATGARLQIDNMRRRQQQQQQQQQEQQERGQVFVTLAMDATTGATEAFQLSDVAVQMVDEGMFAIHHRDDVDDVDGGRATTKTTTKEGPGAAKTTPDNPNPRVVPMRRAVLVDGRETRELDSVLCLVNTALLSHVGTFAGGGNGGTASAAAAAAGPIKRGTGRLTKRAKASLLAALMGTDDRALLEGLCDFNVLLALDRALTPDETEELCSTVRRWARGQKQGTKVGQKLKLKLQGILET